MTDMTDPVADLRDVCLELSDGLQKVAKTLHLAGQPADTAAAMIALGPLFERFGEAMRHMSMGYTGRIIYPCLGSEPSRSVSPSMNPHPGQGHT